MLGIKTQESSNFIKFFEIVQNTAKHEDKVFFLECEDGNSADVNDMDVCDLQGWLIPKDNVEQFESVWKADEVDDEWSDFFVFAVWEKEDDGIIVKFLNN